MGAVKHVTLSTVFKFHYPERGRKLDGIVGAFSVGAGSNSITPKGDGNSVLPPVWAFDLVFKFHYPERGRKLNDNVTVSESPKKKFKFHYPERGRKLACGRR